MKTKLIIAILTGVVAIVVAIINNSASSDKDYSLEYMENSSVFINKSNGNNIINSGNNINHIGNRK